jgi:hypothetical protein
MASVTSIMASVSFPRLESYSLLTIIVFSTSTCHYAFRPQLEFTSSYP